MNLADTRKAAKLLSERTHRSETIFADVDGGYAFTAFWNDGGQRLFYTLQDVCDFLNEKQVNKGGRPRKDNAKTIRRGIKVSQQVDDYLREHGSGVIEDMIRKSKKFREWVKGFK